MHNAEPVRGGSRSRFARKNRGLGTENGEVASWLIIVAALAAAAVLAGSSLAGVFSSLASNVEASALGGEVLPLGPGDPGNPGTPANPGDPGTPANPGDPGNPGTPANPGDPGEPLAVAERGALLATDVYDRDGGELPPGWSRIDPNNLPQELIDQGITPEMLVDREIGYDAAVYQNEDGEYVVSFRGTDGGDPDEASLDHWNANLPQNAGWRANQYDRAVELVGRMVEVAPEGEISITGHSLGGGLASVAALTHGIPATTYDSAGINPRTLERYGTDAARAEELITAYRVDGEILSNDVVPVQLAGIWTRQEMQPVLGTVVTLPAIDADGNVLPPINDPGEGPGIFASLEDRRAWRQAMAEFEAEGVRRHGMDFVLRGLEAVEAEEP